jgi:hypothetical protein
LAEVGDRLLGRNDADAMPSIALMLAVERFLKADVLAAVGR